MPQFGHPELVVVATASAGDKVSEVGKCAKRDNSEYTRMHLVLGLELGLGKLTVACL